MLFFHQNNQHVSRNFEFWPKSLHPDLTGVAILLVDFFGWVFQMLKIPFEFFWNIENFVLPSKQSVWSKNRMFWWLLNFDQNRCIRTLPAWPFFGWFFEMLKIPFQFFWNIQNVVLSSKQSDWSKNSMFCWLFNFDQNRCIRTLPAWPFFGWFFEMLKIPFQFFWNIQNVVLSSKHSDWSKNSMFCWLFNFDQNRCIRALPAWPFCWLIFLVDFFKCWKYLSNSSETFKMLFFHQNNQFEAKTACFADFSILTKIAVSGPYRRCHFVSWIFWLIFWNVENTLRILLKHSKCCSFIKTIRLKQKQHVLLTFQFWPKSPYPDLTGVAIFRLIFWNVENTLPILLKHSKCCSFIKTIRLKQKQHVLLTFQFWPKSLYPDLTGVAIFRLIFWNVENTLPILLKHSKCCSFIKIIRLKQKQHVLLTFQFWPKLLYPDLTGVAIFRLIFWNVENTLPILLKHSKCCSFIKTIRLKQKQHVLLTFQFWPKSLYPGLTGVAILLVDFFGWFFEMLKIPFQFFWKIQNVVLSSKQSDWSKNSMFCWLFNFDQNRCIRTLRAWPFFGWFFEMLKIPFQFFWNIQNVVLSSKQSDWSKNSMFCWLFNFDQNAVFGPYRRGHFVGWFFWLIFWNVENTFRILLKHSKCCSFIKTISLKQKQHVLRTFHFWPKSLYPDLTGVAILLVEFFGWWKNNILNVSEELEGYFQHFKKSTKKFN